jgi:ArsR family transcriptional regulator
MGASKTDQFTEQNNELSVLFKALGHPARLAVLDYLLSVNTCICGDIVNVLPLAQPTVSQHLKELKNAGIIKGTIEGTAICYCINPKAVKALKKYFSGLLGRLEKRKLNCC